MHRIHVCGHFATQFAEATIHHAFGEIKETTFADECRRVRVGGMCLPASLHKSSNTKYKKVAQIMATRWGHAKIEIHVVRRKRNRNVNVAPHYVHQVAAAAALHSACTVPRGVGRPPPSLTSLFLLRRHFRSSKKILIFPSKASSFPVGSEEAADEASWAGGHPPCAAATERHRHTWWGKSYYFFVSVFREGDQENTFRV